MAAAETAKLIASLELQDKMSAGLRKASANLGKMETSMGRIGTAAQKGFGTAARNLAKIGAVAAVGIGVAVKSGIESLADLETAVTSVDGAISQMGLSGKTTGAQIATWANEIETAVGAAFDDKAITAATATLIRFGKVAPANIRPAMEVMTDLAAKTGSVESASELLAKALADPTKAAGKLARQGIVLTKAQQKTIATMVEMGDVAGAQAYILAELEKTTKGAAAASQGPYRRAMSVLADVTEDAQRALAEGFLPVLMRASDLLSKAMADPKVIANIRSFGKTLASGLDSLIGIAQNLPWAQIGDSLKLAGAGAKAVLGAFVALPPWVQTAVLTSWGLNKLTGGALGSIIGELSKGLIKGVLGINAGVVNLKAATVIGGGGGGVPGAAPAAGPGAAVAGGIGASGLGTLAAMVAAPILMNLIIPYLAKGPQGSSGPTLETNKNPAFATTAVLNSLVQSMTATATGVKPLSKQLDTISAQTGFNTQATRDVQSAIGTGYEKTAAGVARLNATTASGAARTVSNVATTANRIAALASTTSSGLSGVRSAAASSAAAIRNKKWAFTNVVNVRNTTTVSVRAVSSGQKTVARYTGGRQTSTTYL